jgi:hypothetical protein
MTVGNKKGCDSLTTSCKTHASKEKLGVIELVINSVFFVWFSGFDMITMHLTLHVLLCLVQSNWDATRIDGRNACIPRHHIYFAIQRGRCFLKDITIYHSTFSPTLNLVVMNSRIKWWPQSWTGLKPHPIFSKKNI